MIHLADPQTRPVVTIVFTHVRKYGRVSKSSKRKQISSESNVHYWQEFGSGRVDHWWYSCLVIIIILKSREIGNNEIFLGEKFTSFLICRKEQLILLFRQSWLRSRSEKVRKINVSSMIHSARPTVPPVVNIMLIWSLFWLAIFWKVGTDERTETCAKIMITAGQDCR